MGDEVVFFGGIGLGGTTSSLSLGASLSHRSPATRAGQWWVVVAITFTIDMIMRDVR